jgi:hypothetical protein
VRRARLRELRRRRVLGARASPPGRAPVETPTPGTHPQATRSPQDGPRPHWNFSGARQSTACGSLDVAPGLLSPVSTRRRGLA